MQLLANRDHFRSCMPRNVEEVFAPLGVDPQRFYHDRAEREWVRTSPRLGVLGRVVVMSGKLHRLKRVVDVVQACRRAGVRLILVGTVASDVAEGIAALGPGNEIILPQASPERLRAVYNAADVAVFTTFSVSYWEAHATGLHLILPASPFTALVFSDDPNVATFGSPDMFRVADEEYRQDIAIAAPLYDAIQNCRPMPRQSRLRFSAKDQCRELAALYSRLVHCKEMRNVF